MKVANKEDPLHEVFSKGIRVASTLGVLGFLFSQQSDRPLSAQEMAKFWAKNPIPPAGSPVTNNFLKDFQTNKRDVQQYGASNVNSSDNDKRTVELPPKINLNLVDEGIPGLNHKIIPWSDVSDLEKQNLTDMAEKTYLALERLGVDKQIINARLVNLKVTKIEGGTSFGTTGRVEMAATDKDAIAFPHEFGGHNFFWVYDSITGKLLGIDEAIAQVVYEETLGKGQFGPNSENCGLSLGNYPYSRGATELRQADQELAKTGGPQFIGVAYKIYYDWENLSPKNKGGVMPENYFIARLAEAYHLDKNEITRILDKPLLQCPLPS